MCLRSSSSFKVAVSPAAVSDGRIAVGSSPMSNDLLSSLVQAFSSPACGQVHFLRVSSAGQWVRENLKQDVSRVDWRVFRIPCWMQNGGVGTSEGESCELGTVLISPNAMVGSRLRVDFISY